MRKISAALFLILVISCQSMPGLVPQVPKEPQPQNIPEALANAGGYIEFYSALEAANMLKTLEGKGPFTVFAPTDKAFANFIPGAMDYLHMPEHQGELQAVMKYHIVPGKWKLEQLKNMKKIKSMLGMDLTFLYKDGVLNVDKAHVKKQAIECSNGLIYEIDSVLLPKH